MHVCAAREKEAQELEKHGFAKDIVLKKRRSKLKHLSACLCVAERADRKEKKVLAGWLDWSQVGKENIPPLDWFACHGEKALDAGMAAWAALKPTSDNELDE